MKAIGLLADLQYPDSHGTVVTRQLDLLQQVLQVIMDERRRDIERVEVQRALLRTMAMDHMGPSKKTLHPRFDPEDSTIARSSGHIRFAAHRMTHGTLNCAPFAMRNTMPAVHAHTYMVSGTKESVWREVCWDTCCRLGWTFQARLVGPSSLCELHFRTHCKQTAHPHWTT